MTSLTYEYSSQCGLDIQIPPREPYTTNHGRLLFLITLALNIPLWTCIAVELFSPALALHRVRGSSIPNSHMSPDLSLYLYHNYISRWA